MTDTNAKQPNEFLNWIDTIGRYSSRPLRTPLMSQVPMCDVCETPLEPEGYCKVCREDAKYEAWERD